MIHVFVYNTLFIVSANVVYSVFKPHPIILLFVRLNCIIALFTKLLYFVIKVVILKLSIDATIN